MVSMSNIHKFSKISMAAGLLFASTSWVHAMDLEDEDMGELAVALALSMQSPTVEIIAAEQKKAEALTKDHVYFNGSDEDLFAYIEAQQELDAQPRANHRVADKPIRQVNHDLGMDTTDLTDEDAWALIQAHHASQLNDLTPAEWEAIKQ